MSAEPLSTDTVLGAARAWLKAREDDPQKVGVSVNKSGAGVISTMADEITRLRAALKKVATEDLDEGELPGLGEEAMLADAVSIARRALRGETK